MKPPQICSKEQKHRTHKYCFGSQHKALTPQHLLLNPAKNKICFSSSVFLQGPLRPWPCFLFLLCTESTTQECVSTSLEQFIVLARMDGHKEYCVRSPACVRTEARYILTSNNCLVRQNGQELLRCISPIGIKGQFKPLPGTQTCPQPNSASVGLFCPGFSLAKTVNIPINVSHIDKSILSAGNI